MQKVISLLQPWAQLTVTPNPQTGQAEKRIETRSWPTNYRGRLAIHASKSPRDIKRLGGQEHFKDALYPYFAPNFSGAIYPITLTWTETENMVAPIWLPLGAIVGHVRLVDCIQMTAAWIETIGKKERAFGHYEVGRWAWLLADAELLPQPIPARGRLGIWDWEEE